MNVDHEGYVNTADIESHQLFQRFRPVTIEKLQYVIDIDGKQRFSMIHRGELGLSALIKATVVTLRLN